RNIRNREPSGSAAGCAVRAAQLAAEPLGSRAQADAIFQTPPATAGRILPRFSSPTCCDTDDPRRVRQRAASEDDFNSLPGLRLAAAFFDDRYVTASH